jgi:hypothetical protein
MIRVEIIANHSVEENIMDALRAEGVGKYYTKYPNVFGVGTSGPRMGDAIWPEENFALVIWCEEEEARGIERALVAVKEHFPEEGIKLFMAGDSTSAPMQAVRSGSLPAVIPLAQASARPSSAVRQVVSLPVAEPELMAAGKTKVAGSPVLASDASMRSVPTRVLGQRRRFASYGPEEENSYGTNVNRLRIIEEEPHAEARGRGGKK